MGTTIQIGPLLGFEGEVAGPAGLQARYTVVFQGRPGSEPPTLVLSADDASATRRVPFAPLGDTVLGPCFRAAVELPVGATATRITYAIEGTEPLANHLGDQSWSFRVRALAERPRVAFASCNGLSSAGAGPPDRFAMWRALRDEHTVEPYSLLILGGDQVYADSLWDPKASRRASAWAEGSLEERLRAKVGVRFRAELDRFYAELYRDRWKAPAVCRALATIPNVMIWDDHDIFDGWGSYHPRLQNCAVFQAVFDAARRHFELFQIRGLDNRTLLNTHWDWSQPPTPESQPLQPAHYSWGFSLDGNRYLAMDNRSQRTSRQVMPEPQWRSLKAWLAAPPDHGKDLFVISPVPVLHRSFEITEATVYNDRDLLASPSANSMADDVRDHWRSRVHQGERLRLMEVLLAAPAHRVVLLSGDVHIGACGVITDSRGARRREVYQVTSSPLVHPPPRWFEWAGLLTTSNDRDEQVKSGLEARMLTPNKGPRYLRDRNFASLRVDDRPGRPTELWVTWHREDPDEDPSVLVIPDQPAPA